MNPVFGKALVTSSPVTSREDVIKSLHAGLNGRVSEAWLFGSVATNKFTRDSDIDLFLVVETSEPFLTRALAFSDLYDLNYAIDILVYTPEEFKKMITDPSPGFWRTAVKEMIRVV